MLQHPDSTEMIVYAICAIVFAALIWLTVNHPVRAASAATMTAYLILGVGSLVEIFWSLYQMAPSGLQLYFDRNVDPMVLGFTISPQWVQNINTFVIAIGGPLTALLFTHLRSIGWKIDVPKQFALSLVLMGTGLPWRCRPASRWPTRRRAAPRSSGSSSATCCKAWASC